MLNFIPNLSGKNIFK